MAPRFLSFAAWCPGLAGSRPGGFLSAGLVPQVRVHRLDANLGLGLTRAEEHAGLATCHFEFAISSRPLRLNLHHTHLAEGVVPKTAPLPIARVAHQPALHRIAV